ncbi:MAG: YdcF family protein [Dyella sp.]|uniref:YdcF family protein n=1 Tax=Dyella sp. TaxID=1869338 RepID=UPI003F7D16DB
MSLTVLGILVLLACGLAWLGWRRSAVAVLVLTLAGVVAVGDGPLTGWMLDRLQAGYTMQPPAPWAQRNVILLLGAGTVRNAAGQAEPPLYGYGRIARAAALYRQCHAAGGDCKVLASGGDPLHNGHSEAAVYGDLLLALGVPASDLILEQRSLSTWQNAQFSRPLLLAYQPQRVLLVSSGLHLRRSLLYFAHFGIRPEPVRGDLVRAVPSWLPQAWNAALFDAALHEYIGLVRYRVYNALGKNTPPITAPLIPAAR